MFILSLWIVKIIFRRCDLRVKIREECQAVWFGYRVFVLLMRTNICVEVCCLLFDLYPFLVLLSSCLIWYMFILKFYEYCYIFYLICLDAMFGLICFGLMHQNLTFVSILLSHVVSVISLLDSGYCYLYPWT